jgi:hypothetical protein
LDGGGHTELHGDFELEPKLAHGEHPKSVFPMGYKKSRALSPSSP